MRYAFVTPRYGADINGGPEHACRLIAEHVGERHDVDIITTCGRDPHTWQNEYQAGSDRVRGVLVHRFAVSHPHDAAAFHEQSARLFATAPGRAEQLDWVRRLGPWSPGLIDYLKRGHRSYDALVFFSLYHPTTVHGIQVAPERSIVFPHLQLNPALRFGLWPDLLDSIRGVGYLSGSERRLMRGYVRAFPHAEEVVGIGVESVPQQAYPRHQQNPADALTHEDDPTRGTEEAAPEYLAGRGIPFRRRHRLYGSLALYGGRVDSNNGFEEMFEYFDSYAAANGDTALLLMGVKMMKVPDERYVRMAGILPDRERMVAYEAADVTLAPDPDDLLNQSVLESFAVGTPVLMTARNHAAVEHARRANGGLYYATRDEFVETLRLLMTDSQLREKLGESGRQYIKQHYRWDAVLGRFERLLASVKRS